MSNSPHHSPLSSSIGGSFYSLIGNRWFDFQLCFISLPNCLTWTLLIYNPSITMLYFLISFVSFLILSKSFTSKPLSSRESGTKIGSIGFWGSLSSWLVSSLRKGSTSTPCSFFRFSLLMSFKNNSLVSKEENEEEEGKVSLLDLPDLPLECILGHLSPAELCSVATVCTYLRDTSRSDHLWKKHMERKWGKVFGDAACRQWKCHVASKTREKISNQQNQKGIFAFLHGDFRPLVWIKAKSEKGTQSSSSFPEDSVMALYLSLESGKFWFPAQVYNREVIIRI